MPVNDFAGPVIQAFMQGRQIANDKADRERRAQQDIEEKKFREAQLKQMEAQIKHVEKADSLAEQEAKIAKQRHLLDTKQKLAEGILGGTIKPFSETKVDFALPQASQQQGNPLDYQANSQGFMGIPAASTTKKFVDLGDGNKIPVDDIGTLDEVLKIQQQKQTSQLGYDAAKARAQFAPRAENNLAVADKQIAAKAAEGDKQRTFLEKQQDKLLEARAKMNDASLASHERLGAQMRATQIGIASKLAENRIAVANINHSNDAQKTAGDLESLFQGAQDGTVSYDALSKLSKEYRDAITIRAAKEKINILPTKHMEGLANISSLHNIKQKAKEYADFVGSGRGLGVVADKVFNTKAATMKEELRAMLTPFLKAQGYTGTLSDKDLLLADGYIPTSFQMGGSLKDTNQGRINQFDKAEYHVFRKVFPKGVYNTQQEAAVAARYGVDYKTIHEFDTGKRK